MEEMWEKGGERMDEGGRKNIKIYIYINKTVFVHLSICSFPLTRKKNQTGTRR